MFTAYICLCFDVLVSWFFLLLGNSTRCVAEQTPFNSDIWTHPCGSPFNYTLFPQLRGETGLLRTVMDVQDMPLRLWDESPPGSSRHPVQALGTPPGLSLSTHQGAAFCEELLLRTMPLKVKQCLSLNPSFRDLSPTSLHPHKLACLKENIRMEIHSNFQRQPKQEIKEGHSRLAPLECLLSKQNLFYLLFEENKFARVIWSLNAPFGLW